MSGQIPEDGHELSPAGHGDLGIAVPAANFTGVRGRFPAYVFDAVGSSRIWERQFPS